MDLLVNDLSMHGQFTTLQEFQIAIQRLMRMRQITKQLGHELYCHERLAHVQVTRDHVMQQALRVLTKEQQRALMQWLTKRGPYWEGIRIHSPDDYLEHNGDVVTDRAIGEAGFCCMNGIERHVVSVCPSEWCFTPIEVTLHLDSDRSKRADVPNYWSTDTLESALQVAPAPISSWVELENVSVSRFSNLTFSSVTFGALKGVPFNSSAAERIMALFRVLDELKSRFDNKGQRTREGHQLCQDYFTGSRSWFSDSSDTEKAQFQNELTFPHPELPSGTLFCPWHGKINSPKLRVHFSWPVQARTPLYIVYVGQKITRK